MVVHPQKDLMHGGASANEDSGASAEDAVHGGASADMHESGVSAISYDAVRPHMCTWRCARLVYLCRLYVSLIAVLSCALIG